MSNSVKKLVSRIAEKTMIRDTVCPRCGALRGLRCAGGASHQARWGAYKDQQKKVINFLKE